MFVWLIVSAESQPMMNINNAKFCLTTTSRASSTIFRLFVSQNSLKFVKFTIKVFSGRNKIQFSISACDRLSTEVTSFNVFSWGVKNLLHFIFAILRFPSQTKSLKSHELEQIELDKFKNRKLPKIPQKYFESDSKKLLSTTRNSEASFIRFYLQSRDEFNELLDKQFR